MTRVLCLCCFIINSQHLSRKDSQNFLERLYLNVPWSNILCKIQDETQWYNWLIEFQISRHERRASQLEELNEMPLYPTEEIIWNESIVPTEYFSGEGCLALPKLNLQFLTLHDYLLRNFNLFRLESTCAWRWLRARQLSFSSSLHSKHCSFFTLTIGCACMRVLREKERNYSVVKTLFWWFKFLVFFLLQSWNFLLLEIFSSLVGSLPRNRFSYFFVHSPFGT